MIFSLNIIQYLKMREDSILFGVAENEKSLENQGFGTISFVSSCDGGGCEIRTHAGLPPNGFQGTLTTRKLENFRGRYQTLKDAETPVFTRVFGSFLFEPRKILAPKHTSISKRISKKFLEIFLEMHPCLCGCGCRVSGTATCFSADIIT